MKQTVPAPATARPMLLCILRLPVRLHSMYVIPYFLYLVILQHHHNHNHNLIHNHHHHHHHHSHQVPLLVEFAAVAGLQPPPLRVLVSCIAGEEMETCHFFKEQQQQQ
jgi:hypothetical protein